MKKIEFVGPDLHERFNLLNEIKYYLQQGQYCILLGDYIDSFEAKGQAVNFLLQVIDIIKEYKIPALIGNHDAQYFYKNMPICKGHQSKLAGALKIHFDNNMDLFKVIHVDEDQKIIFSHAGLSHIFLNYLWETYKIEDIFEIEEFCNQFPKEVFWSSGKHHGGWDKIDGPMWCRPWIYSQEVFPEYIQVVGHTFNETVMKEKNMIVCDSGEIHWMKDLLN